MTSSASPIPSVLKPETTARGLLLFAHGARDAAWARPFERLAEACRDALGLHGDERARVALAFLEFMAPDLPGAGDAMAARGLAGVDVVPVFLGAGGHVRRDVPALLETLRARHPHVDWRLRATLGEAPEVIDAMARAAVAGLAAPAPDPDPGPDPGAPR